MTNEQIKSEQNCANYEKLETGHIRVLFLYLLWNNCGTIYFSSWFVSDFKFNTLNHTIHNSVEVESLITKMLISLHGIMCIT